MILVLTHHPLHVPVGTNCATWPAAPPSLSSSSLCLGRSSPRILMLSCGYSSNCILVCVWVCCTRWSLYSGQPSHEHRYLKTGAYYFLFQIVIYYIVYIYSTLGIEHWLWLVDNGDWDHGLVRLDGLGLSCLVGLDIKAWCLGNKQHSSKHGQMGAVGWTIEVTREILILCVVHERQL